MKCYNSNYCTVVKDDIVQYAIKVTKMFTAYCVYC